MELYVVYYWLKSVREWSNPHRYMHKWQATKLWLRLASSLREVLLVGMLLILTVLSSAYLPHRGTQVLQPVKVASCWECLLEPCSAAKELYPAGCKRRPRIAAVAANGRRREAYTYAVPRLSKTRKLPDRVAYPVCCSAHCLFQLRQVSSRV
jgi:hypothetical protein